jgi:hypothetical protein
MEVRDHLHVSLPTIFSLREYSQNRPQVLLILYDSFFSLILIVFNLGREKGKASRLQSRSERLRKNLWGLQAVKPQRDIFLTISGLHITGITHLLHKTKTNSMV